MNHFKEQIGYIESTVMTKERENSYYICHRQYYKDESLSLYCLQDHEVFLDLSQSLFIYSKFKYWKHKEF